MTAHAHTYETLPDGSSICFECPMTEKKGDWGGARDGAGRPYELNDPVRLVVQVEREDREKLNRIAKARETTAAQMVRDWIGRLKE